MRGISAIVRRGDPGRKDAVGPGYTCSLALHPWPDVPEEHRWTIELMEERLEKNDQTPEELTARAEELRRDAESTEIDGRRDAWLAVADRYEELAASRLSRSGS
jgi:hypothetical protein